MAGGGGLHARGHGVDRGVLEAAVQPAGRAGGGAGRQRAAQQRKTGVKDAEWIATLLRHGLLRASFIPDRPLRELRELTRYRTSQIRERSAEANRLQKMLEGANIKLGDMARDVLWPRRRGRCWRTKWRARAT